MRQMLILSETDLRALLTMRDVIGSVENGFRALARGHAKVPERLRVDVPMHDGVMLQMPGYVGSVNNQESALGTKIVSVFDQNAQRGLDLVQAVYLLLDSGTGVPLSLMDGRFITAIRTAATSAVATKFMASSAPKRLAVFGAGVQAQFHVEAMIEITQVEQVMIASRTPDKANELAERIRSAHKLPCDVVSPETAARASNLICTCTSSPTPLFDGSLLTPGTHINAVGAFTPSTRELDTTAVQRSRVIIDAETSAGREAGEILLPLSEGAIDEDHVNATLADVVSGKVTGRQSSSDITLFKSCGHAIEDLVTARLAYSKATAAGVGAEVRL